MASIFGRQVIVPLTNKSGGSVIAGDVVIVDSANNESFTTTTSAGVTTPIGIAQESIANNATGRVLLEGYAALVNVNASVTRLNYGKTHTVAKQATDAGAARISGTFCVFLKSGTTPSALVYPVDLAGAALTDPTSLRGHIIRRGAASLEALQAKTNKQVVMGDGTDVVSASILTATSYAGYTSVGASFKNMNGTYACKITLAATTLVLNIAAHVKGNATNLGSLGAVIYSDSAGTPLNLIAYGGRGGYDSVDATSIGTTHMNTTARWIEMPVNAYLTAADYWIGVVGGTGGGGIQLAYDTSPDVDKISASFYPADNSVTAFGAATDSHSIRALILV